MLQPSHARRHATLLATGASGRPTSSPAASPIRSPSPSEPILHGSWSGPGGHRPRSSPRALRCRVRPASVDRASRSESDAAGGIRSDSGESSSWKSRTSSMIRSSVAIGSSVAGLEPDTVYRYALGDGTPHGWGPWNPVKTAPAPDRGPSRFLYLGDAQTGLERWGRLLETAVRRHPDIDFVVLAGDLVDRGNERTNWDHFFLRAAPVFDRLPVMPCVGNHEYLDVGPAPVPRVLRAAAQRTRRDRSGPGVFVRGRRRLLRRARQHARRLRPGTAATAGRVARRDVLADEGRLEDRRSSTTRSIRRIPGATRRRLREHWVPIFDKHHVDLVLQGHDHAYLRTYPLRGHRRVERPDRGDDLRDRRLGRQVRRPDAPRLHRSRADRASRPIRRSRSTRSRTASPIAPGPKTAGPSIRSGWKGPREPAASMAVERFPLDRLGGRRLASVKIRQFYNID